MSDPRDMLKRKASRFPQADEPWEKVQHRLNRRQRNRRIGSGALALVIAASGAVGAYRAFGPGQVQPDAGPEPTASSSSMPPPSEILTVWPEHTTKRAREAQAAVDGGNENLRWRLDHDEVVRRFVDEVLERRITDGPHFERELTGSGSVEFTDDLGQTHQLKVGQPQRQGEGGIWSVLDVTSSERLAINSLSIGFDHDGIQGGAPGGTEVEVTIAYGDPGDQPTFTFVLTTGGAGKFSADLRTHYGDWLPIPTETGRIWVRALHPGGGYSDVVAMALPAGSYCYPCS